MLEETWLEQKKNQHRRSLNTHVDTVWNKVHGSHITREQKKTEIMTSECFEMFFK